MELDELRTIWRTMEPGTEARISERQRHRAEGQPQGQGSIHALAGRRSQGPIARMRRNLVGELVLVLATYVPAILFMFFGPGGRLAGSAWVLTILLLLFAGYAWRKDKLLRRMLDNTQDLQANLRTQVECLEKTIRGYTVAGTLLVPVMAILVLALIFGFKGPDAGWISLLPWVLALIPVTLACYYVNTWHVQRIYGQHIRRLKEILAEMDRV